MELISLIVGVILTINHLIIVTHNIIMLLLSKRLWLFELRIEMEITTNYIVFKTNVDMINI